MWSSWTSAWFFGTSVVNSGKDGTRTHNLSIMNPRELDISSLVQPVPVQNSQPVPAN